MGSRKTSVQLSDQDEEGLAEMRCLIEGFLKKGKGSDKVREYLASVVDNDGVLLIYLKGRKYRVKHAWETLKRKAEVRFNDYPEVFIDELPTPLADLERDGKAGCLKYRDQEGRRIGAWNGGTWNPDEISLEQYTSLATYFMDKLLVDEDALNNGIVMVVNCPGFGLKHARQFSLRAMLRLVNVFWYAYPIRVKGIYFINVPSYLQYVYQIIRPFLAKKIKERFLISTTDKQYTELHERLPPKVLPKFLGGVHENEAAFDLEVLHYQ